MRLKALELRGFKSFADPVSLPLSHRLMVVIGPNGCGKSNIADALRWIVGEQKNRLLRIEKADNLIFNGSARRKPLPYAEVSLEVLDFSPELPRILFTKRVHRTGETEYLINGEVARLKDFLAYFWEIGLSPHSFLDGAQVEALIQDRGGARRALLESLAGIEKYHYQRKELLAEIEKTRHSLSELDQIITQLAQQISLLSHQAQRVKQYQNLKDTYQILLTQYIAAEVAHYTRQINQTKKEEEAIIQNIKNLESEIEILRLQLREDKRKSLRDEISFVRAAHEELLQRMHRLAQEESRLKERIAHLQKQLSDSSEEITHRQRQEKELQTTDSENVAQLDALIQKQAALLSELDALNQRIHNEKSKYQQVHHNHQQTIQEAEKLRQEIARLSAEKSRWEAQGVAFEREKQNRLDHLRRLRENQALCEAEHAQKAAELATYRQRLEEAKNTYQNLEKTKSEIEHHIASLQRKLHEIEAERRGKMSERVALESLMREAAHWPGALRRLIQTYPDRLLPLESIVYADKAILPLLAVLLRLEPLTLCLSEPALLPEVQKALAQEKEGLIQLILATDLAAPLRETQPPTEGAWLLAPHIQTLPGWEALPQLLWGDVWVVPEIQTPPLGMRYLSSEAKLLRTPTGTYYFLGIPKTAHIGLPHRIHILQEAEAALTTQATHLQSQIETHTRALRALPIEEAKKAMEAERERLVAAEKAVAQTEVRFAEIQKNLQAEETRLQHLLTEAAQHQERLKPLADALLEAQTRLEALQQQLQVLSQQSEDHQKALQSLATQHSEKRYQLAQVQERLRQEERHQRLLHQQLSEVRKRLSYLLDQQQRLKQELEAAHTQIAETQKALSSIRADLETISQRRKSLEELLDSAEKTYKDIESSLANHLSQREQLIERQNRLCNRRQDMEHRLQLLAQRLEMETSLRLSDLPEPQAPRLAPDEVERQLQTLRTQMNSLGELNFEAFAMLQAEKTRLESLQAQKADISAALERLEQLLLHLDREAAQRFTQTFEAVREAFIRQFREIFSEGDACDMMLVEPDKPLSSAIEIVAKPRGKRPLSLAQLSGGEKALTIIALLMGVLSIRPPALTILDEVDAPLDDVNADKFGRLLRRFGEASQLLVITHNKITMSYAEVLYGVTMPEPGVSTILGVELAQALRSVSTA